MNTKRPAFGGSTIAGRFSFGQAARRKSLDYSVRSALCFAYLDCTTQLSESPAGLIPAGLIFVALWPQSFQLKPGKFETLFSQIVAFLHTIHSFPTCYFPPTLDPLREKTVEHSPRSLWFNRDRGGTANPFPVLAYQGGTRKFKSESSTGIGAR